MYGIVARIKLMARIHAKHWLLVTLLSRQKFHSNVYLLIGVRTVISMMTVQLRTLMLLFHILFSMHLELLKSFFHLLGNWKEIEVIFS